MAGFAGLALGACPRRGRMKAGPIPRKERAALRRRHSRVIGERKDSWLAQARALIGSNLAFMARLPASKIWLGSRPIWT